MATLTSNPDRQGGGVSVPSGFTPFIQGLELPDVADGSHLFALGIFSGALTGDMRLALYTGSTLAAGPDGATLVEDLGVLEPNVVGWGYVFSADLPTLTGGDVYWLMAKGRRIEVPISDVEANSGHFDSENGGLWFAFDADRDEDTAFESTWPATGNVQGSAGGWISVRIVYAFDPPTGERTIRLAVLDDVEANGGSILARIPEFGRGSTVERSLRNDGFLTLRAPVDASWLTHAMTGRIIRLTDPVLGADAGERDLPTDTEEWRIRRIQRAEGPGSAEAVVEAAPIIQDLTHVGLVYALSADGRPDYSLGEQTLTLQEAWDDLIAPMLDDQSITHWRGEFSGHEPVTVTVADTTPLALLTAIADAAGVDIWAQHDGADPIRLLSGLRGFEDGAQSLTRRLNLSVDGRRITRLTLDEDAERLATVVQASREAVGGASTDLGLYGLVLRVTGVNGSTVTVVDPESGPDPQRAPFIRFTDQFGGAEA